MVADDRTLPKKAAAEKRRSPGTSAEQFTPSPKRGSVNEPDFDKDGPATEDTALSVADQDGTVPGGDPVRQKRRRANCAPPQHRHLNDSAEYAHEHEYDSGEFAYSYGYEYSYDASESSGYLSNSVGTYESSGNENTHSEPEDDPSPSLLDGSPARLRGQVSIEAHRFTREYVRPPGPPRAVNLALARFVEMDTPPSEAIESCTLAIPAFTFSEADEDRLHHFRTCDGPLVRPIAETYRRFLESENRRLEPGGLTAPRRPVTTGANPRGSRRLVPMANAGFGEAPAGQVTVRFL
jgi:hypothetical protein